MVYWRDWKKINISIVVSLPVECCVQNLCDSEWRWWKWKRWIWWDCDSKPHWGTQGRHHIFHVWRQHSNKYWHCTATHLKLVGPNYYTSQREPWCMSFGLVELGKCSREEKLWVPHTKKCWEIFVENQTWELDLPARDRLSWFEN